MIGHEIAGIALALITGAVIVSALSKNANTQGVIQASTTGFANLLSAVTAPVAGGQGQVQTKPTYQ